MQIPEALRRPGAYPYPIASIDLVETHISWVFLAGDYVYKVKKPVDFGFVDYTTLERRRFYCEEEVRLNRRLSAGVYLGVVPITSEHGELRVEGAGDVMEYAVKMRRLSQERMLDRLLAAGEVTARDMHRLAGKIARFHELATTNEHVSGFGSQEAIAGNWQENFDQVRPFLGATISETEYLRCQTFIRDDVERLRPVFQRRVAEGRIRDCHGDLRAESVWMAPDGAFQIYDCIEFNERLRHGDVASEVAFLASDLDARGRPDLAWEWVARYASIAGDREMMTLLPFYKCYRAFVRGKVESLAAEGASESGTHREAARQRFALADLYTTQLAPAVFVVCGQVGSGKSTLAHGLASLLGLPVVSTDAVRKELAGVAANERRPAGLDAGLYQPEARRAAYDELYQRGRQALAGGSGVILDATFSQEEERRRSAALAAKLKAGFFVLWAELPEALIKERLARRVAEGSSLSDAGPELYELTRSRFQPPTETPASSLYRVDMSRPIGDSVSELAWSLRRRAQVDPDLTP